MPKTEITDDFVAQWRDTWALPHMQQGLQLLKELGLPRSKKMLEGFSPLEHGALLNARREGYYECISFIEQLMRRRSSETPAPEPLEEWAPKKED